MFELLKINVSQALANFAKLSLANQIKLKNLPATDVLQVSYESTNPEEAAAVVNKIMSLYIEKTLQTNRAEAVAAGDFIAMQLPKTVYYFGRWLLKELPLTSVKAIAGKATLLDLLMTPIFLLTRQAHAAGKREAKLLEQALQIEWLNKSHTLNSDPTVTAVTFNS